MGTSRPTLVSFSHKYWSGKTHGFHRYSTEEWLQKEASELRAMLPCGGTLLDVGCGSCQLTTYLAQKFEKVYAVDFSETMLTAARQRIERLGLTNIRLFAGTAQQLPDAIIQADVILSYGVVQYLTLEEVNQHLRECRRVLTNNGLVCMAQIPNSALQKAYYYGKLIPTQGQFAGRLRGWIKLTRRRAKAHLRQNLIWDGVGNWFCQADLERAANEAGFEVEFRNSWFYDYRFHALFWPKRA